jgi:PAT family beta-lactamase induction signal transducer AmpG
MPVASLTDSRWLRFTSFAALYFAQGIPIGLLNISLPAWLAEHGVSGADIAWYQGIVTLPWGFKLFAGPFMDRFALPAMGRRRPWVMAAQLGLTGALGLLALFPQPVDQLTWVVAVGLLVNSFAAVQDVAVDGMAIDVLPESERGRANALMAFGQVAGFSSFAALSGVLLHRSGLPLAALVASLSVGLVLLLATLARERSGERLLPWSDGVATPRAFATERTFRSIFAGLFHVLFLPMSVVLFLVEFLVRIRDGIALAVVPVFAVQQLGIASSTYSQFQGLVGVVTAAAGVAMGPMMDRFGVKPLYLAAIVAGAALSFLLAATQFWWSNTAYIVWIAIAVQLVGQMMFIGYIALSMNICWAPVAATQFAIYMSLSNLSRSIGATGFALVADRIDYATLFAVVGGILLLAAVLLGRFDLEAHRLRLAALDAKPGSL